MGNDLSSFLATYAAVSSGNLTSWSIGGPTSKSGLLAQTNLVSAPQGLSGSHNKYETDVSPTRGDLYTSKNAYQLNMTQFNALYNLALGSSGYDLSVLTPFRAARFNQSINTNPRFFNGPFSGVAVQPAAYTFIYRFMSNKSSDYPSGYLNAAVLKSFFSITGDGTASSPFVWTEGAERIPANFYKRAIGDEYTIPYYSSDLGDAASQYPQFYSVGGNTGTTNSFTGVNVADVSSGAYNAQTLTQGNNALCFALQFLQIGIPDLVKGLFKDTTQATQILNNAATNATLNLDCSVSMTSENTTGFAMFPGATGTENYH